MKRHTFEYVKDYFKERGCELLEEEYKDSFTKMRYKCNCENVGEISLSNFKKGRRCKKCGERKRIEKKKFSYKFVKQYFKNQGCELLEKKYEGCLQKLKYKCNCGNVSKIRFGNFKQGIRCRKCGGSERLTYKYVYNFFKKQGCELLEKNYINNHIKMRYKCNCGNKSKIQFNNFKNGARCMICSSCGYSKESQKLFNAIYEKVDKKYKNKTYYATLNNEFGIYHKDKCFKYDYVNSKLKKVIEYNGSAWHPVPSMKDDDIGWFALDKNKTAKETRDYEKIKYEGLKIRGFTFLTIWDHETKKDFNMTVQKCLDFLIS